MPQQSMLRQPILFTSCSLFSFVLGLLLYKYLSIPDGLSEEEEDDDEFALAMPAWLKFCRLLSRSHWEYSTYAGSSAVIVAPWCIITEYNLYTCRVSVLLPAVIPWVSSLLHSSQKHCKLFIASNCAERSYKTYPAAVENLFNCKIRSLGKEGKHTALRASLYRRHRAHQYLSLPQSNSLVTTARLYTSLLSTNSPSLSIMKSHVTMNRN
ncbi:hypothetical protein ALC53_07109 [Atta colombica]|uniref:Uncharacterized protein n=1 Tax=Atta colombica TaxID=520822 RepID=A0A151I2T0_9HYME|nr:hypothetical protein ALC53_07109 [Atta colombica]